jgi:hypothetical protein
MEEASTARAIENAAMTMPTEKTRLRARCQCLDQQKGEADTKNAKGWYRESPMHVGRGELPGDMMEEGDEEGEVMDCEADERPTGNMSNETVDIAVASKASEMTRASETAGGLTPSQKTQDKVRRYTRPGLQTARTRPAQARQGPDTSERTSTPGRREIWGRSSNKATICTVSHTADQCDSNRGASFV